jgi:tight adherence protein C
MLVYAGNPPNWDAERVFAYKLIVPFVAGTAFFLLMTAMDVPVILRLLGTPLFAAAGWYAPEWIVRSRAADRQKQIQLWLADSIDLLSITVEAGLGFDAAVQRVAREVQGPLGQELFRVVHEMQLGKSRIEALRALAYRTTVVELRAFVSAMVQASDLGIPTGQVLHEQAKEMRTKHRQLAEEKAQKLPVKILFPMMFCIFPALFIVVLGPAALSIIKMFSG